MNIFKALAVKDIDTGRRRFPWSTSGPRSRGRPGAMETVALEVRRCVRTSASSILAGHGVPQTVIDDAFAASREFTPTPLELKRSLKINENNIGYPR